MAVRLKVGEGEGLEPGKTPNFFGDALIRLYPVETSNQKSMVGLKLIEKCWLPAPLANFLPSLFHTASLTSESELYAPPCKLSLASPTPQITMTRTNRRRFSSLLGLPKEDESEGNNNEEDKKCFARYILCSDVSSTGVGCMVIEEHTEKDDGDDVAESVGSTAAGTSDGNGKQRNLSQKFYLEVDKFKRFQLSGEADGEEDRETARIRKARLQSASPSSITVTPKKKITRSVSVGSLTSLGSIGEGRMSPEMDDKMNSNSGGAVDGVNKSRRRGSSNVTVDDNTEGKRKKSLSNAAESMISDPAAVATPIMVRVVYWKRLSLIQKIKKRRRSSNRRKKNQQSDRKDYDVATAVRRDVGDTVGGLIEAEGESVLTVFVCFSFDDDKGDDKKDNKENSGGTPSPRRNIRCFQEKPLPQTATSSLSVTKNAKVNDSQKFFAECVVPFDIMGLSSPASPTAAPTPLAPPPSPTQNAEQNAKQSATSAHNDNNITNMETVVALDTVKGRDSAYLLAMGTLSGKVCVGFPGYCWSTIVDGSVSTMKIVDLNQGQREGNVRRLFVASWNGFVAYYDVEFKVGGRVSVVPGGVIVSCLSDLGKGEVRPVLSLAVGPFGFGFEREEKKKKKNKEEEEAEGDVDCAGANPVVFVSFGAAIATTQVSKAHSRKDTSSSSYAQASAKASKKTYNEDKLIAGATGSDKDNIDGGVIALVDTNRNPKKSSKYVVGWSSPPRKQGKIVLGDVDGDGLDELVEIDGSGRLRIWGAMMD